MAKVSGSYESVVRGVSEQNPQSRRSGQHFEQVNMISDPVRGLARRHGSVMEDEASVPLPLSTVLAETESSRVYPFFVGGVAYDLIARSRAGTNEASFAFCANKDTGAFVPVSLGASPLVGQLVAGGVSAVANVGRYCFIAGNTIVPTAVEVDNWDSAANKRLLAGWIRSGLYSRTFSVTLTKTDGTTISGEYKTKSSSYPTLLDTSDILASDTEYQKKVNDRVNAYNSAVTAWIGEAAEDITPANIADKLVAALIVAGVSAAVVYAENGYIIVDSADYVEIELKDAGDDSLVRGVGNVIANVDLVSSRHFVGKVVKVEPETTVGDPIYLKAFAKNGTDTGWAEVVWRESAGYSMTPEGVFCIATVEGGTLFIAGSAAELSAMSAVSDVPDFKGNQVGDAISSPLPSFINRRIDYMGVFQDRLIVGSGATVFASRPGDYLNWFRKSVLSIQDDDPWEGYPLGAEDDIIKYGVFYDRSLLLYGDRFQYIISGRTAFTPATANVAIASAYEGATEAAPLAAGNFVFYTKHSGTPGKETTSMHQMQPGVVADVSESYTASQQLDSYLAGLPVELLTMTSPNMVLLRTNRDRRRVYIYSYLDNPQSNERLFDSWSHWSWAEGVGNLVGISKRGSDILAYMVKASGTTAKVSIERFVRDTSLDEAPYLDSLRPYSAGVPDATEDLAVALGAASTQRLLGAMYGAADAFMEQYADQTASMYYGFQFPASVTPTNPYAKDRNDQAILAAALTLSKITVAVTDTGGLTCDVVNRAASMRTLDFSGRILGSTDNLIGQQPVVTSALTAYIGAEVKTCKYTLGAVNWLPLTINSIDWQGQLFFNTRRA